MRPGVSANQRHVCRFDENARWRRRRSPGLLLLVSYKLGKITVLITAPKGGFLPGEGAREEEA